MYVYCTISITSLLHATGLQLASYSLAKEAWLRVGLTMTTILIVAI